MKLTSTNYSRDNFLKKWLQVILCRAYFDWQRLDLLFSRYRILKRRIAWLIGRWAIASDDVKLSPLIWEILSGLLSGQVENTDTVVHLSAIVALRQCADVSAFSDQKT